MPKVGVRPLHLLLDVARDVAQVLGRGGVQLHRHGDDLLIFAKSLLTFLMLLSSSQLHRKGRLLAVGLDVHLRLMIMMLFLMTWFTMSRFLIMTWLIMSISMLVAAGFIMAPITWIRSLFATSWHGDDVVLVLEALVLGQDELRSARPFLT